MSQKANHIESSSSPGSRSGSGRPRQPSYPRLPSCPVVLILLAVHVVAVILGPTV